MIKLERMKEVRGCQHNTESAIFQKKQIQL